MEEDGNAHSPPFWLQSSNSSLHELRYSRRRRLSRASSFLLNSSAFLIVLLVIVLCFILIVIPKFVQFTSQLIRPQSVKKSWDSLNLLLVLFAIVCGFLGRNAGGDDSRGSFEDRSVSSRRSMKSNPTTPRRWDGYTDHRPNHFTLNRMRSSSSYPDLRLQESSFDAGDHQWRFYDDTHVTNHRYSSSDQLHRRRETQPELERQDSEAKSIVFDRSEIRDVYSEPVIPSPPRSPPPQVSPPRPPSPPPTPPPPANTIPKMVKRRPKRTHKVHSHTPEEEINQQHENGDSDVANFQRIQLPPLSPPLFYRESEQKSSKNEKKRTGASKEIWSALRRRKKKQRQKSVESFEAIIASQRASTSSLPPPSPPPPPPPPLPSPSVLQNLFSSRKGKHKKVQSTSLPDPPPPSIASSEPKPKAEDQNQILKPQDPPMELDRLSSLNDEEYHTRIGGESPYHPIPPPPPPPPPFRMHGDFDSVGSNSSTPRAISPEMDESEADAPPATSERKLVKDPTIPMFCSSPDVNSKADKFIARFRADLKLQKMNSIKEKTTRKRSNLGRTSGPGPSKTR
ncbi:serine/arginine repetitive matrix protein 1-like [Cucumis melo var. makuwa]|uniref:Serine/arginine repetitive matrix protein 1-like n=1 Tax=Cucumis melo var. makuwa TaxID=1194695 RepID=A0A5A7V0Q3_CUCMM|nr:serine/arginine repetitive matrix protein 1-like [Cucumis melo var. makuwa]TYK03911.1 serine/arginine repetitive matrix protein 1-like [Cucumis melo var. makuwa]